MRLISITILVAASVSLAACAAPATSDKPIGGTGTAEKSFGAQPFWDGDVCVEIRPDGKRMIAPASSCPPKT